MRGLAREGKTPPDGFMAPRYNAHPCVVYIPTHYRVLLVYQTMNSLSLTLCVQGMADSLRLLPECSQRNQQHLGSIIIFNLNKTEY